MEEKVSENMAEIKDIIAETGEEAKMLAKFVKPVHPHIHIRTHMYDTHTHTYVCMYMYITRE
jgi:hypothetical protein